MTMLIYVLKSALLLVLFFFLWCFLLRSQACHSANRSFLLAIVLLSFILPIVPIQINKGSIADISDSSIYQFVNAEHGSREQSAVAVAGRENPRTIFVAVLSAIYLAGFLTSLIRSALSILHLRRIRRKSEIEFMKDGTPLVITPEARIPFSWMKWIFVSEADWQDMDESILLHEKAHIRLHHSYDILLMGLATALQWFNPVVWLLRRDLMRVHEYQADEQVLQSGVDAWHYQHLLLNRVVDKTGSKLVNGFSQSALGSRIEMMQRPTAARGVLLRTLAFIPLILACMLLSARTVDKSSSKFEREYLANTLPSVTGAQAGSGEIQLVGYTTVVYHGQDSVMAAKIWSEHKQEIDKLGGIYTRPGMARTYSPLANAIIEVDGIRYIADKNGIVRGLSHRDIKRPILIGRDVGEKSFLIEFDKPKLPAAIHNKYNTLIFDLGHIK